VKLHPIIAEHRAAILCLAERHGARSVRLFGSFARGQTRPDSDVDLLIEAGPRTTPWFPGGLVADLEELLQRRVDVVEPRALYPRLRDRILNEAMEL
jgi:predicted nucleotidyltransferase